MALVSAVVTACGGTTSSDLAIKAPEKLEQLDAKAPTTLPQIQQVTVTTRRQSSNKCVANLSLEEKVGQLIFVLTTNPRAVVAAAATGKIGGLGLVSNQVAGVESSIAAAKANTRIPLAVASDEEGGTVQRLVAVLGKLPSARQSAKTMSATQVGDMWKAYAQKMRGIGLTMNFGPVLDVGYGVAIKSRAYSDTEPVVEQYGLEVLRQVNAGGITPVAKHWPGLGSGASDPHGKLSLVPSLDKLKAKDLLPFDAAIKAGAPAIMVTHVNVPGLTNGEPATLSSAAISYLRKTEGFTGVIMTDSLGMGAITTLHSQPEAAELALKAGNDVVLVNGSPSIEPTLNRLVDAVRKGRLSMDQVDASVERWLKLKGMTGDCPAQRAPDLGATDGATSTSTQRDPTGQSGQQQSQTTLAPTLTTVAGPLIENGGSSVPVPSVPVASTELPTTAPVSGSGTGTATTAASGSGSGTGSGSGSGSSTTAAPRRSSG